VLIAHPLVGVPTCAVRLFSYADFCSGASCHPIVILLLGIGDDCKRVANLKFVQYGCYSHTTLWNWNAFFDFDFHFDRFMYVLRAAGIPFRIILLAALGTVSNSFLLSRTSFDRLVSFSLVSLICFTRAMMVTL